MSSLRLQVAVSAASFLLTTLLVTPAAGAQAPLMGWTTVNRVTTDSGSGHAPVITATRSVRAGERTRIEMFDGDADGDPRTIMVMDSAAGTLLSMMPGQKMAMLIAYSPATMRPMLSAVHLTPVGARESHTDDLGGGPAMLGHPTRHYRTTGRDVMHYAGPTRSCDRTTTTRVDVWTTRDTIGPRGPRRARRTPAETSAPLMATVVPPLDSNAMKAEVGVRGRPLRTETRTTVTREGAPPESATVTDEVTELRYGPLDSTLFVAPAAYRVVDQRAMMTGVDQAKMFEAMAPMFERIYCGTPSAK